MDSYLTVSSDSIGEIVVDRSRFIAVLHHVKTEKEALDFVAAKRREHYDARHTVYAYRLSDSTARFSDDGEPHSTAGKPVMDVISGAGLYDVVVVVTRYFGGILLGTGGLVRAYSASAAAAVDNANVAQMIQCAHMTVVCEYSSFDSLKKLLTDFGCVIKSVDYTEFVSVKFLVKDLDADMLCERIVDTFSGRLQPELDFVEFTAVTQ